VISKDDFALAWNDEEVAPDASPRERAALQRTRTVAQLLDDAIPLPFVDYRIGLDPLLGLLPIAGDVITGVIGLYVLVEAALVGTPPARLARMLANLVADIAIGTIPVVGDVFDAVWKANVRNVDLFEEYVTSGDDSPARR
jgi:hypothetical protein